ncbi:hypothetical protein [Streptomyces sp. TRM68367]|uniref:hypothetical protein n=1 Tax=Streptomyces sp. TRM68367 TaxID=2758415 RepID=UPI0029350A21|nr:hypothetical protein [Streptomyces sp. TRM68367]
MSDGDHGPGVEGQYLGTVGTERSTAAQRAYLTAFFDQHLRGRPQHLPAGPSPAHPDVRFIP